MKSIIATLAALLVTSGAVADPPDAAAPDNTIPLEKIIASVAHKANRKFVIDPRVQARIRLVGEDPSQVSYDELLSILALYGYVTSESGGYVLVLPDANARQVAQPQLTRGQTYPDAQIVNYTIPVLNGPAGFLVPILRPLLPQYAHLAASYCSNTLLIVDRYANVKRIEALVKTLDVGTPYKPEKCVMPNPMNNPVAQPVQPTQSGHALPVRPEQPAKRNDS